MAIKLNELTVDNFDSWPSYVKNLIVIILFAVIILFGYWFDYRTQLMRLDIGKNEQRNLLETIKIKQRQTANFLAYQEQEKSLALIFGKLLNYVPTRSEIPTLLNDISKKGIQNKLQFVLFKPEPEIQNVFYAELPVQISVKGSFHQLAQFISDIEGLDRIVTLHDFTIKSTTEKKQLLLTMTVKTYRYLADNRETAVTKEKKDAR